MIEARGIDLVAAADDDPAKLEDFKQRWDVSALYTDYREMIEKEQIDVVCLTTRPEPRAEITVGLAELGVKAIFATKPMCRTLAEADTMIDTSAPRTASSSQWPVISTGIATTQTPAGSLPTAPLVL